MENNAKSSIGQAGPVLRCWTACLLVSACLPAAAYAEILYTFTDLGSLGGERSLAFGINDAGQIVGTSSLAGTGQHAFVHDSTGMHDLGGLGKLNSIAYGINNAGQVVGNCSDDSGSRAFATNPTRDLGTLASGYSRADAINDDGLIVGISQGPAGDRHLFSYSGTGPMRDLGSLGGPILLRGPSASVNASGQIACTLKDVSGHPRGVRIAPGGDVATADYLETLDDSFEYSRAFGINDAGTVVGSSYGQYGFAQKVQHAVLWPGSGGVVDLDPLRRGGWSEALGINNAGQVVGWVDSRGYDHLPDQYAFIYENGILRDLNSLVSVPLGWKLNGAYAINEAGQIVGSYSDGDGTHRRAFLLTPIPEPATLALILVGCFCVARRFRRA